MPKTKPHLNIFTVGENKESKRNLTTAIVEVLAKQGLADTKSLEGLDKTIELKEKGVISKRTEVKYETEKFSFTHIDCEGKGEIEKLILSSNINIDCFILLFSIEDGTSSIREQVLSMKGIRNVAIFVDITDESYRDSDTLEFFETEVRKLFTHSGFERNDYPIVFGSVSDALNGDADAQNEIKHLLHNFDEYFREPSTFYKEITGTKFRCLFYLLAEKELGRKKTVFRGHFLEFFFNTTERRGSCTDFLGYEEMLYQGQATVLTIELQKPIKLSVGQRFIGHEATLDIALGQVIQIIG